MIKNIIFDLGGVLIDCTLDSFFESLGYNKEETNYFIKIIFKSKSWNKFETALLSFKETEEELIGLHPKVADDLRNIFKNMDCSHFLKEKEDVSEYLKHLKLSGYNIYILSDLSYDHYKYNSKMSFFKYVDGGVYSFEVHKTKPSLINYEAILLKYGLTPEETIFIDDRKENVEASLKLGIKGIQFTNLSEVKEKVDWLISGKDKMKCGVGVGIIVLNEHNEVLLLLRNDDAKLADSDMRLEGTYTLPSGKVKCGETFEETGKRKLKEESNLDVLIDDLQLVSLSKDINEYADYTTVGLICLNYTGDFYLKNSGEFTGYGWFPLDNLPKNLCIPSTTIIDNYLNKRVYCDPITRKRNL